MSIGNLQMAYNEIDPGGALSINLNGGWGAMENIASRENQITPADCWCNSILTPPASSAGAIGNLKAAAVIGGMSGASFNSLTNLRLVDNLGGWHPE